MSVQDHDRNTIPCLFFPCEFDSSNEEFEGCQYKLVVFVVGILSTIVVNIHFQLKDLIFRVMNLVAFL